MRCCHVYEGGELVRGGVVELEQWRVDWVGLVVGDVAVCFDCGWVVAVFEEVVQ